MSNGPVLLQPVWQLLCDPPAANHTDGLEPCQACRMRSMLAWCIMKMGSLAAVGTEPMEPPMWTWMVPWVLSRLVTGQPTLAPANTMPKHQVDCDKHVEIDMYVFAANCVFELDVGPMAKSSKTVTRALRPRQHNSLCKRLLPY